VRGKCGDGSGCSSSPFFYSSQGNLEAICREISKAVNDQFEHMTLVIRFAAMGYRDKGDSQPFFKCGFIERPVPATREAALKANTDDANRVSAWVRFMFSDTACVFGIAHFVNGAHDNLVRMVVGVGCEQLRNLTAEGGDDEAEDVVGAIHEVCRMDWKSSARFCVLVCDAPGHGTELHDSSVTDHYSSGMAGMTTRAVMEEVRRMEIDLLMCHLRPSLTMKMDGVFRRHFDSIEIEGVKKVMAEMIDLSDGVDSDSATGPPQPATHFVFVLDERYTARACAQCLSSCKCSCPLL
jgi:hypothetical protein